MTPKLFLCAFLLWLAYRIYDQPKREWKRHFKAVRELENIEDYYRSLRAGFEVPKNSEKWILDLSEHQFEKEIYRLYLSYPLGYEIAESKWRKYINRRGDGIEFVRMETSHPTEDNVFYISENQQVKTPTD